MLGDARGPLLVASVVVLAGAAGVAGATSTQTVDLTYEVTGLDSGNGTVDVQLVVENPDDRIESMVFFTDSHGFTVSNVSATGGSLERVSGGVELTFEPGPTILHYTVGVEKRTAKGSEGYNAFLAENWGVLKAESLGISFRTRHDARVDIVWDGAIRFGLPDGWSAAGPWNRTGPETYELPDGDALPRGFYAIGEDLSVTTRQGPWKSYRYVQIGADLSYEGDVLPYLQAATPYYSSVYGNHTGPNLVAISAPDPMHEGGLGGWNSLYVHESTDLEILAHEYAHVWQRYRPVQTVDNPQGDPALEGGSSLWIVEGDADYRGPLSLVATEFWSPSKADQHFEDVEERADREGRLTTPLDEATYGNTHEQVAYEKGALVLHAFQRRLSAATDGAADSASLVRKLNAEHSPVADGFSNLSNAQQQVNNSEIRDAILDLASSASDSERADLRSSFEGYVHGDDAPTFDSIEREGHLSFDDLLVDPPAAQEGDPSTLSVRVTNTGPTHQDRTLDLLVDGTEAGQKQVSLEPGESEKVIFPLPDLDPGTYRLRVAYLTAEYKVLTPPDLVLDDVELVPLEVTAGGTSEILSLVRNRGEAAGPATVEVRVDGTLVGSTGRSLPGGLNETLPVTIQPETPGERTVEVTLLQGNQTVGTGTRRLSVAPDADGDGVRDAQDAYPSNPNLSGKSAVNDVRNAVPVGPWIVFAALAGGALVQRRR
jgi:hypothetical protein